MVTSSFPFYKDNVPYGHPFFVSGVWNSSSKPAIILTPLDGNVAFVKEIRFSMTQDFNITAGSMIIKHSEANGSNKYLYLVIDSLGALFSKASEVIELTIPSGTTRFNGVIEFKTPVKVFKSENHTFSIIESLATVTGTINIEIVGWTWYESDYNEAT